jgi:hypothetical protein
LPINHLLGENCGTRGRIGEVGLEVVDLPSSAAVTAYLADVLTKLVNN